MAEYNEVFSGNPLYQFHSPDFQNTRQAGGGQNHRGRGHRPNRFHGARNSRNFQRYNRNGGDVQQGERPNVEVLQQGVLGGNGGRRNQQNNIRHMSYDRNVMYGSQESLPDNNGGRRHRSAVRSCGGGVNGRFEQAHGTAGSENRNRQRGGWREGQQGRESCFRENVPRRGVFKQLLGFKRLEELSNKDPGDILITLANSTSGFGDLLAGTLRPDQVILVVKLLAKACKASFLEVKVSTLANACRPNFIEQLSKYIGAIPTDDNAKRKEMLKDFLGDLFLFCHTALGLLPANASDIFPQLFCTVEGALRVLERSQGITLADELKKFDELHNLCITAKKETEKKSKAVDLIQYQPPPNDYRELNLYPSTDDIFPENGKTPFVRPNIVQGSYVDVEHYLDVQFRLLREDFVKPLREGIRDYLTSKSKKSLRFGSVRFYPRVIFKGTKAVNNTVGLLVCFDPDKKMRKIKWEYCRRFMFGSLVCFSKDNFQTIIFAKVLERNLKDLKEGYIMVDICNGNEQFVDDCNYVMIESEVYFEPYYHVMKALQNMTEDSFPMSEYIVHVLPHSNPPTYLCTGNRNTSYDVGLIRFPVLREEAWPSASQLKLDESQYKAFKLALTREFVVIQGPPGTGKTFLGLKVATVLLKNVRAWNNPHTPILVVCFTNHALDQFLEGLLTVTNNLIRVGGQSKNENVLTFSLKERRQAFRRTRELGSLMRDQYTKISKLMAKIKSIQKDLDVCSSEGIVSINTLVELGIAHTSFHIFRENGRFSDRLLLSWLTDDMDEFGNVDRRGEQAMNDLYPTQETLEEKVGGIENDCEELEGHNVVDDDFDWGIDPESIIPNVTQALSLVIEKRELARLTREIRSLGETAANDVAVYNKRWYLEDQLEEVKLLVDYITMRLKQPQPDVSVVEKLALRKDLYSLTPTERWVVYRYWVSLLQALLIKESSKLGQQYRKEMQNLNEVKMMDDLEVIREADVVGMTTTGAARLQPLLQELKPKIVIVEEAAEVMESHVVVSLTSNCQHLILIGDHQQLRPNTADYHLARRFYFDISLFERMLKNGMHCETLKVQHRMRPEIAKLIVPAIYPELHNHESVLEYEKILGVEKSLFFVTHKKPEDKVEDTASAQNSHEADFILALCRYLLMQGYSPDQITVLTPYSGQMFYLRNERRNSEMLKDIKMTVVDNFQGEESDIILLSLVRSNEEAHIGFVGIENRVCVALSRARKGLFIIGNMDNLTQSSELWRNIKSSLEVQDALGEVLPLKCQVHPSECCQVRTASDFLKYVPEGGCMKPCRVLMSCGHECQSVCHIQDREHISWRCLLKCTRFPPGCVFEHNCPKLCWEDCGTCKVKVTRQLPCGHTTDLMCHIEHKTYNCQEIVTVTLPHCGHVADKPCYRDAAKFRCPQPCEDRLSCGHSCELMCHVLQDPDHLEYKCRKQCTKTYTGCSMDHKCAKRCHEECGNCTVRVQRTLVCGHTHKMACSQDPATFECRRGCNRVLPCGHKCKKQCYETCGDCAVKVKKVTTVCGHTQSCKCCEEPDPSKCRQRCTKMLSCGHKCAAKCCDPCGSKPCMEMVPSPVNPACGHALKLPCHIVTKELYREPEELLQHCQQPCGVTLQCEHTCKGTCGVCLQGRIHIPCGEKCGRVLICGHSCEIPCAESCPPCGQKCTYRCKHSICSRKCGQPCIPCMEPCDLGCDHHQCTRLCHEMCNVSPCTRPCKKLLKCGHPCIGYCGDPCPPLCRVCDKDEVTEVFFGDEDDYDARFVYLEDCKHTLLGEGLDRWLQDREAEISMKGCPKCKTPIMRTQRFTDMIKAVFKDVVKVKAKLFGDLKAIEASREQLKARLDALNPKLFASNAIIAGSKFYHHMYEKLFHCLQPIHKGHHIALSAIDASAMRVEIDILTELVTEARNVVQTIESSQKTILTVQLDVLLSAVGRSKTKITAQTMEDLNLELLRFQHLAQFLVLEHMVIAKGRADGMVIGKNMEKARKLLHSKRKYTRHCLQEVLALLEEVNKILQGGLNITDKERKEILLAVGERPGHWFKCPNGHIYVITECGGAMEEGTCNECGEKIGGRNHTLLASNVLASEMDGAKFAAWSNQQNMMNYDLNLID